MHSTTLPSAAVKTLAGPLADAAARSLLVVHLDVVPYVEAWELQKRLAADRAAGLRQDTLLLLQHPPTFTLGRNSSPEHVLVSGEELAARMATLERIERGGEVTYHGPGQLLAYPIIKLEGEERSIAQLVDKLEQAIIDTLDSYGIPGDRLDDQRGVWTRGCKIASVGLAVKRWVVIHGMALNVSMDMSYFSMINPCGHPETIMTSMAQQLGEVPDVDAVGDCFAAHFAHLFGRTLVAASAAEVGL